ncbi:hypothetical protein [Curtobacterium sp. MCJR17_043]|nr:hypothetical protein [Curtobacterium sp. MCJR17_043]WIB37016.1 hypothetical protein DEJ15_09155 [Curtobacterium sp. MCJR17_043]
MRVAASDRVADALDAAGGSRGGRRPHPTEPGAARRRR